MIEFACIFVSRIYGVELGTTHELCTYIYHEYDYSIHNDIVNFSTTTH
jgi:hypothetical protein